MLNKMLAETLIVMTRMILQICQIGHHLCDHEVN